MPADVAIPGLCISFPTSAVSSPPQPAGRFILPESRVSLQSHWCCGHSKTWWRRSLPRLRSAHRWVVRASLYIQELIHSPQLCIGTRPAVASWSCGFQSGLTPLVSSQAFRVGPGAAVGGYVGAVRLGYRPCAGWSALSLPGMPIWLRTQG